MTAIRDKAEQVLDAIPSHDMRSNKGTEYEHYTGLSHATMQANWDTGGIMTGCNAFVGWYSRAIGSPQYLGRFDLATYLPSIGKGDAWIRSSGGRRPQRGDILRHKSFHVDVCDGWDGDILLRIAAGQGGPKMGCDILKHVRGKAAFDPGNLEGWVDLDIFFGQGSRPDEDASLRWLTGWWSVWDGNQYYYYFEPSGDVSYVKSKPRSMGAPPKLPLNQGDFTIDGDSVVIEWNPADGGITVECFFGFRMGVMRMNGTSNRYAPLVATKM
ncbi:MAG: hypothetical protein U1F54_12575 [Burkholderiales bacterium]